MDMAELHTDGNAAAGVLQQIFLAEVTSAQRVCQSCRQENAIGAHLLYKGAGMVLRCPVCGDVAACIAKLPDDFVVSFRGAWTLAGGTAM
jgi:Family of unknown function (DUF6510)